MFCLFVCLIFHRFLISDQVLSQPCEECLKYLLKNVTLKATKGYTSGSHTSVVCLKEFARKYDHKRHLLIYSGGKPFKCGACLKDYTEKGNLDTHLKIHIGEKPFKCKVCFKDYTEQGNLYTFTFSVKPFKCEVCQKEFIQKCHLESHQMIHTGEKPFKCSVSQRIHAATLLEFSFKDSHWQENI